jgi:hypothetical protein
MISKLLIKVESCRVWRIRFNEFINMGEKSYDNWRYYFTHFYTSQIIYEYPMQS